MPEYGIEKCYYALQDKCYTDDDSVPAYLPPRELPGAVNLTADTNVKHLSAVLLDDKAGIERNYRERLAGCKGVLRVVHLPLHFLTDVLGYRYENGIYTRYGGESDVKAFALMFETSSCRRISYDVTVLPVGFNVETVAEKVVFEPVSLNVVMYPRRGDLKLDSFVTPDDNGYSSFFREVR